MPVAWPWLENGVLARSVQLSPHNLGCSLVYPALFSSSSRPPALLRLAVFRSSGFILQGTFSPSLRQGLRHPSVKHNTLNSDLQERDLHLQMRTCLCEALVLWQNCFFYSFNSGTWLSLNSRNLTRKLSLLNDKYHQ